MRRSSVSLGLSFLIAALALDGTVTPPAVLAATRPPAASQTRIQPSRYDRAYHKVWELVRDNYYQPERLSGWNTWEHRFDGTLRTRDDLRAALRTMLRSLHDDYTYVLSEADLEDRAAGDATTEVVQGRVLPGNIGYVRISGFTSDRLHPQLAAALKALEGTDGLIVDLRNNHGGYIRKAQQAFAMLAQRGTFITYIGRYEGQPDYQRAELQLNGWVIENNRTIKHKRRLPDLTEQKPMAVLVNNDTRSAAELLAGALRINRHATIIGTTTFGKGVLQNSFTVAPDVQVKIVTAHYFLPDGSSIHQVGLTPDVTVRSSAAGIDDQLARASEAVGRRIAQQRFGPNHALANAEEHRTDELR